MEIKLFRKKFSQIKIVDKNQKGFMRQNCQEISGRIYAEKMCTNFSKDSCRKISTFSRKDLCLILITVLFEEGFFLGTVFPILVDNFL